MITVYLFSADGQPYTGYAQIRLTDDSGVYTASQLAEESHIYQVSLEPGRYALEASTDDLVAPPQQIVVDSEEQSRQVYLGEAGWPFYRMGQSLIPFAPREDLLAIAYPFQSQSISASDDNLDLVEQITQNLPLAPYRVREDDLSPSIAAANNATVGTNTLANGAILLFSFEDDLDVDARVRVSSELNQIVGDAARVGMPIDLGEGTAKVMDNRFVVRFVDETQQSVEEIIQAANGEILRRFVQTSNTYLIRFTQGSPLQGLRTLEEWNDAGLLIYGEPDLMAELVDDIFPYDDPDDPT